MAGQKVWGMAVEEELEGAAGAVGTDLQRLSIDLQASRRAQKSERKSSFARDGACALAQLKFKARQTIPSDSKAAAPANWEGRCSLASFITNRRIL